MMGLTAAGQRGTMAVAVHLVAELRMQTGGSHTMGDKGGKKGKDKSQKQKEGKQAQEAQKKQAKQKKSP